MADHDELDEDLFADLYENDDSSNPKPAAQAAAPAAPAQPEPTAATEPVSAPAPVARDEQHQPAAQNGGAHSAPHNGDVHMSGNVQNEAGHAHAAPETNDDNYGPIGIKEDG
ncbi:uncharacterized protein K452DRAFT_282572 [Aplosporella prunicola CBS 121167]|uniref:Uncharacterized protein n=1 Tax=Aplosporella prunicola CBS 121167 TaxID=1176127 RepID=A0A6A6BXD5_9PEZI|nr:uncharacterized protein K452DRAFT_282572 [Aplosporella prunicola CBS 121167]KAF2147567.1 hypothetical protein K452DRAFT_282572 [Aplosporella prunicola CBS 121167]